jgi:hypothetical protein
MFASDEELRGPAADSSCAPYPVVRSVYDPFETGLCPQFTGIDGLWTTCSWAVPSRLTFRPPLRPRSVAARDRATIIRRSISYCEIVSININIDSTRTKCNYTYTKVRI